MFRSVNGLTILKAAHGPPRVQSEEVEVRAADASGLFTAMRIVYMYIYIYIEYTRVYIYIYMHIYIYHLFDNTYVEGCMQTRRFELLVVLGFGFPASSKTHALAG